MRKTLRSLLPVLAILAPATTLAIYGLRAYRAEALLLRERYDQDQLALVRLVADRTSETARKTLEDLEERCRREDPDAAMEQRFVAAHALARHIFLIRDGRLVYPTPTPSPVERPRPAAGHEAQLASALDIATYVGRLRETRRLARLLAGGLRAEHGGRLAVAATFYGRVRRARDPLAAQALLGTARLQRRLGRPEAAAETYAVLRARFAGQQDSEGVSFALLADAGSAEVGGPNSVLLRIHAGLMQGDYMTSPESRRFYLRWVVEELARRPHHDRRAVDGLSRATAHLFSSEHFADTLLRHGPFELQQAAGASIESLVLDQRTMVVVRQRGSTLAGYALNEAKLRGQLAEQRRQLMPPAGGPELSLARLGETPSVPRHRIVHAAVLAPPLSNWTLTAVRPKADPMELLGRRQGLRHQALVLGLILVLLLGLVLTYLGVRRESELARLKSDFASNVSHELKTPLTSIRMYAEMLQEGIATTSADRDRYHQVIIRESERLGRLIANVLDFSRLERGTRRYDLQPVELEELTRDALETFGRLSEGERISIRMHGAGPRKLPAVVADRDAAVQSILNLLSNAAKYSRGTPDITVELRGGRGEVGVRVRDRGIGIPSSEQKKIFDDFYRAPGARKAGVEGTGLGLALVRRHLAACGGRVELWSAAGQGSEFTLWFREARQAGERARREWRRTPSSITLSGEAAPDEPPGATSGTAEAGVAPASAGLDPAEQGGRTP